MSLHGHATTQPLHELNLAALFSTFVLNVMSIAEKFQPAHDSPAR